MVIDWTINIGQILTILAILLAGVGLFYGLRERVALLESRFNDLINEVHKIGERQHQYAEEYMPILAKLSLKVLNGK